MTSIIKTNKVSVDCETLGTAYDAPIIAIGAVAFDIVTGKIEKKTFYKEVELSSAIKSGRVNGETIAWWITQSKRAKSIFETPDSKKSSLATVLVEFSHWYRDNAAGCDIYARGPSQDVTWLEHAFTVGGHGLTIPWRYDQARDVRSYIDLVEEFTPWREADVKEVGTHHNAIDDATYQANVVSGAWRALRTALDAAYPKAPPKTTTAPEEDDEL